jgi:hypothetical protein
MRADDERPTRRGDKPKCARVAPDQRRDADADELTRAKVI